MYCTVKLVHISTTCDKLASGVKHSRRELTPPLAPMVGRHSARQFNTSASRLSVPSLHHRGPDPPSRASVQQVVAPQNDSDSDSRRKASSGSTLCRSLFSRTAIHYSGDIGAWLKAGVFFPVAGGFSFFGEEDDPKSSCLLPLVAGCFRLYGGAVLHAANI